MKIVKIVLLSILVIGLLAAVSFFACHGFIDDDEEIVVTDFINGHQKEDK